MTDVNVDINKLVGNYVKLRDKIKELKAEQEKFLAPFVETMNAISAKLQEVLDAANAKSIKTSGGTVYASTRYSASLEDPDAFMKFVISNSNWDLLDRKANANACRDYIEENKVKPPGVNLSAIRTIGVRRAGDA